MSLVQLIKKPVEESTMGVEAIKELAGEYEYFQEYAKGKFAEIAPKCKLGYKERPNFKLPAKDMCSKITEQPFDCKFEACPLIHGEK